ncbi:IS1 family transposase [Okeania sp. KiyG1]|uniref:IS1 family transposase n=1 Tax=Okeania sp. KiyG1 TaxID=2720165 RepID=UPI001924316F|nr:IS1 family transposase [Okeania sp. KiyG1]GGA52971.1 hypothetical protein CYANOKiyG1_72970 [Okeania sp. KiyG1]
MVKSKSKLNFLAMHCPKCQSTKIIKYGHTHYGKLRFRCLDCGRQFVENPSTDPIDQATRAMIDKMLLERLALAAIACGTLRDRNNYRCFRKMVTDVC